MGRAYDTKTGHSIYMQASKLERNHKHRINYKATSLIKHELPCPFPKMKKEREKHCTKMFQRLQRKDIDSSRFTLYLMAG